MSPSTSRARFRRVSQMVERPAIPDTHGVFERGLDSASSGEGNDDEIEKGYRGVSEIASTFLRLGVNPKIRDPNATAPHTIDPHSGTGRGRSAPPSAGAAVVAGASKSPTRASVTFSARCVSRLRASTARSRSTPGHVTPRTPVP